jgi:hypothetical protein
MVRRVAVAMLALSFSGGGSLAQLSTSPSLQSPPPSGVREEALPPIPTHSDRLGHSDSAGTAERMPASPAPPLAAAAPPGEADAAPPAARVFCDQPVTVRVVDRDRVPERYRDFIGMWSDAAWTPQLCAALVVEDVAPDGTARIVYAFGPMGPNSGGAGGVLHGTGIVRDGELRFQNSDGSQFAFRPIYSDLDGRLTTPKGQSYQSIFKKTL